MRYFKESLLKAFVHPLRIAVVDALREGPMNVGEIQAKLGVEQSTLSQQLAILRGRNLVVAERRGTTVRYRVTDPAIWRLLDVAREIFENHLVSMRTELERTARGA